MHRSTEFRHWREACVSSTCTFAANESVCGTEDMDIQEESGECMSYQVLQDLLQIVEQEVTLRILAAALLTL